MKNLLISAFALIVVCLTVSAASAEPVYEKHLNVTGITIRNTETGTRYFWRSDDSAPTTLVIKSCPGDAKYDCVYLGRASKPVASYLDNDFRRPHTLTGGYVIVTYTYPLVASR